MKRLLVVLLIFNCAVLSFSSGKQDDQSGEVTLTIAGRDGAYGDSLQLAADLYQESNEKTKFEILKLSGSSLFEKTVIDMKSQLGTYDAILIDDPNITQFQKADWLLPLDKYFSNQPLDDDFIESTTLLGRYPYSDTGELFALPFAGNVELFAYRMDLFEKYNLTKTDKWTDILQAAKIIDKNEENVSGVVFRGSKGNPIVTGFLPIFWSFGAKIIDENGSITVNSQEAVNALNLFLELSEYAPKGVSMYQSAQVKDSIYSGTSAIVTEVWPGWINKLEDPSESSVVGKVKVTKHPGQIKESSPMIGVWMIGIPKSSKQYDQSIDFIKFATNEDSQTQMAIQFGNPPTRKSVYQKTSLISKYPWYPAQLDALNSGVARTRTTKWKEIESELGTYLQFALIGQMTAEEALNKAQERIEIILE